MSIHVTPAAVRQYLDVMGIPDDGELATHEAARLRLGELLAEAHQIEEWEPEPGVIVYRTRMVQTLRGRRALVLFVRGAGEDATLVKVQLYR